jgi:predicted MFS family arabinose efflux permease
VSIAFYTGLLVPIIYDSLPDESEAEKFELSMLAMMALGVGEIIGAYLMGRFVDLLGPKTSCLVNMVLVLLSSLTVIYYLFRNDYGFLAYFMAFIWGL